VIVKKQKKIGGRDARKKGVALSKEEEKVGGREGRRGV